MASPGYAHEVVPQLLRIHRMRSTVECIKVFERHLHRGYPRLHVNKLQMLVECHAKSPLKVFLDGKYPASLLQEFVHYGLRKPAQIIRDLFPKELCHVFRDHAPLGDIQECPGNIRDEVGNVCLSSLDGFKSQTPEYLIGTRE